MNRLSRNLRQQATWWQVSTESLYDGLTFATPVLLDCRWEDKSVLFRTLEGEEVVSQAVVYLAQDVSIGDYLVLGDHTDDADPTLVSGAARVRQYSKVMNLRATQYERKALL